MNVDVVAAITISIVSRIVPFLCAQKRQRWRHPIRQDDVTSRGRLQPPS